MLIGGQGDAIHIRPLSYLRSALLHGHSPGHKGFSGFWAGRVED